MTDPIHGLGRLAAASCVALCAAPLAHAAPTADALMVNIRRQVGKLARLKRIWRAHARWRSCVAKKSLGARGLHGVAKRIVAGLPKKPAKDRAHELAKLTVIAQKIDVLAREAAACPHGSGIVKPGATAGAWPIRGDIKRGLFHVKSCKGYRGKHAKAGFADASEARRSGFRPHRCLPRGHGARSAPAFSGGRCRRHADCVFLPQGPCRRCPRNGYVWRRVTTRANLAQLKRRWARMGACAPPRCPPGVWTTLLGSKPRCIRRRCVVR